jgi:ankyrin repeat protein
MQDAILNEGTVCLLLVSLVVWGCAGSRPSSEEPVALIQDHEVEEIIAEEEPAMDPAQQELNDDMLKAAGDGEWLEVADMLDDGADPHVLGGKAGVDDLQLAVIRGDKDLVEELLDGEADLGAVTSNGETALHIAAYIGNQSIVEPLVAAGADPLALDDEKRTALHSAAIGDSIEVVRYLLDELDIDVNTDASEGYPPLVAGIESEEIEMVELLVKKGARVKQVCEDGMTPVHYAASWGFLDIVEFLVKKGANVKATNDKGRTPLHLVAVACDDEYVCEDIAKLLIKKGNPKKAKDKDGKTPHDLAVENGREILAELF